MKHKGANITFLDLDITIKDNAFIYKLLGKPFFKVRMPHLFSKITSSLFYGLFYLELLRAA